MMLLKAQVTSYYVVHFGATNMLAISVTVESYLTYIRRPIMSAITVSLGTKYACNLIKDGDHICGI